MKFLKLFIPFISLSVFAAPPIEVITHIENVYVPFGFDDNDNAQIIIEANLPNLCYKAPRVLFEKINDKIQLSVRSIYFAKEGQFCPQVIVPVLETVDLGLMPIGKHKISINKSSSSEKNAEISIEHSSSQNVDEFIYANVESIEKIGGNRILLKGHNPNNCMELDRVEFYSNGVNTYSVLPIMKIERTNCLNQSQSFSYEAIVPNKFGDKKVLLHVRSMNGKSVNTLFSPDDL